MRNPDIKWFESNLETHVYIQNPVVDIQCEFEPFFYQTSKYLNTQNTDTYFSFYLFRNGSDKAVAFVHFVKDANANYISPANAPFGGIQGEENCSEHELHFLLSRVETWILFQNPGFIFIKTAPLCYSPHVKDVLARSYKSAGFEVANSNINHHINVTTLSFNQIIAGSERRRLSKCKNTGFKAGLYLNPNIQVVYKFIKESRDSKNYPMSLTTFQLKILFDNFPKEYQVFVVTDSTKIIALTVTVRVNSKVLYNWLPADLSDYKKYSPMVLLNEAVYEYCQSKDISILDLGISPDHYGIEKPGLIQFKKNLGAQESLKIIYQKKLR